MPPPYPLAVEPLHHDVQQWRRVFVVTDVVADLDPDGKKGCEGRAACDYKRASSSTRTGGRGHSMRTATRQSDRHRFNDPIPLHEMPIVPYPVCVHEMPAGRARPAAVEVCGPPRHPGLELEQFKRLVEVVIAHRRLDRDLNPPRTPAFEQT